MWPAGLESQGPAQGTPAGRLGALRGWGRTLACTAGRPHAETSPSQTEGTQGHLDILFKLDFFFVMQNITHFIL